MKNTEISTYEQQALDFLTKTNTEFTAEFLKHGKHFDNDEQTRDIYKITLKRDKRVYSFNFGQSITCSGEIQLVERLRNKMIAEQLLKQFGSNYAFNLKDRQNIMLLTRLNEKELVKNPAFKAPTAYDVLACLTKYDPNTFEDFCSDFGYDTDSRNAEKTYNAVKEEWQKVQALFSDAEIEELQEIQ